MARRRPKKKEQREIASRRITRLFTLAEERALQGDFPLADRYVHLARKISMKYLVPIPKQYKRCFCKHCYHYLLPGATGRVRLQKGKLVWYCFHCHLFSRLPLHNKKTHKTV